MREREREYYVDKLKADVNSTARRFFIVVVVSCTIKLSTNSEFHYNCVALFSSQTKKGRGHSKSFK